MPTRARSMSGKKVIAIAGSFHVLPGNRFGLAS